MSEDRGNIVPFQPPTQIAGQEGARVNQLGAALPSRPDVLSSPEAEDSEIAIDTGTGVAVLVSNGGDVALSAPAIRRNPAAPPFNENLAITLLDDSTLSNIASEVLQGVDNDILSRSTWIDQYNRGIDLLGLKIEDLANRGARRNVSRIGHPLMIEAMVKYQAGAEGEMLPAAGPVKVSTIGRVPEAEQRLADSFEDDFNYYLTDVATEYYDDTAQMLMHQAFCGIGYKKIYRCPIRRRPVSESVLAPDLIVSEEATDLDNALRVSHRIDMIRPQLRRMQIVGQYRDVDLGMPGTMMGIGQSAQRRIRESEGLMPMPVGRPEDLPYEILECDVYLDVDYHLIDGYWERRTPEGLPLPYKVTVERNSQQVLGIWRNWRPGDQLCLKRNMYVKYGMVPGLGYHNWGFLQLLGNQTRALRTVWRLLLDAGMFANFPGGIKNKNIRTSTNEVAPGPGEFVDVDAPLNADLTKQFVPMPYKDISSVLVQFSEIIKQDGMRLGATTMLEVGEGRTNVPVGTVLSLIEQQVQVMAAVFKRNHRSQKQELHKLRELFAENPSDLNLLVRDRPEDPMRPRHFWQAAQEFTDLSLSPASDPNVPARIMRVMAANVMVMLAQQMPQLFDTQAIARDVVTTIGKNPDEYVVRNQAPPPPDPKVTAEVIKQQTAQSKQLSDQQIAAERVQAEREQTAVEAAKAAAENETARHVAAIKATTDTQAPYHKAAASPVPPQPQMIEPT